MLEEFFRWTVLTIYSLRKLRLPAWSKEVASSRKLPTKALGLLSRHKKLRDQLYLPSLFVLPSSSRTPMYTEESKYTSASKSVVCYLRTLMYI